MEVPNISKLDMNTLQRKFSLLIQKQSTTSDVEYFMIYENPENKEIFAKMAFQPFLRLF